MAAFEIGFDEISRKQEQQNDETDQIEIDQQEYKRIARGREKRIRIIVAWDNDLAVVKCERETWNEKQQQNPDRP